MNYWKIITALVMVIWLIAGSVFAGNAIMVNLSFPECPYADFHLPQKMDMYLAGIERVPILWHNRMQYPPDNRAEILKLNPLLDIGRNNNARYVVDIYVSRVDLETRKVVVIPEIASRYRVYAVLTGIMRIIDVKSDRMIEMDEIAFEVKAKDRWQFVDDDRYDPDLFVPADKKLLLFRELENVTANGLYEKIRRLTRGNHFDE